MKLPKFATVIFGLVSATIPAGTVQAALIYVSLSDSSIVTYDISLGNATAVQGSRAVFASGSPLNAPEEMVFDAAGNLYTTNRNGNTITKITANGTKSTFASGAGSLLNKPIGLTIDPSGNLYVANENGPSITKITPGGVATTFANVGTYGLASDASGNIYAAPGNTIVKITPQGASSTFATTYLATPRGMAFDTAGNLFVANFGDHTIGRFTPAGSGSTYLTANGSPGPNDVAFDALGNLYIAGNGARNVQKYNSQGVFQFSWSLGGPRSQHLLIQGTDGSSAVPEPGQVAACGVVLAGIGLYWLARRKRVSL